MFNLNEIHFSKLDNQDNGLIPVIVQDHGTKKVLMLGFMNKDALHKTIETKLVTFYSRTKKRLWVKGEESKNYLHLIDMLLDCDNDSLLILASADGPTCHTGEVSCFKLMRTPLKIDDEVKCNASLLPYINGYAILQRNEKESAPYWTESGGKVDVEDKTVIDEFLARRGNSIENLSTTQDKIIFTLLKQFPDSMIATFAFAALREAIEEICEDNSEFIYNCILNETATLKHISRSEFGLKPPSPNSKNRNEAFYLDVGNMNVSEVIAHFRASRNRDCREIVAAKISNFKTVVDGEQQYATFNDLKVGSSASLAKICTRLEQQRLQNRRNMALLFTFVVVGAGLSIATKIRPSPNY